MTSKKQEFGSFYEETPLVFSGLSWTEGETVFLGSGRDALYEVLRNIASRSANSPSDLTVWIPSYYCHPITNALSQEYIVRIYPSTPYNSVVTANVFSPSDVIVVPEYFGNASRLELNGTPIVVLDKTHNPSTHFSYSFDVHFEFGSLRKILPIAEGGYLKPLSAHAQLFMTQPPTTESHLKNFRRVSQAMLTKSLYLAGKVADKNEFLHTFSECESAFGNVKHPSGAAMPIEQLRHLDMAYYLDTRQQNNKVLMDALENSFYNIEIIDDDVFFIISFKDNRVREEVKKSLIKNDVYPAVLWPIEEHYMTESDKDFSQRILVLPTDFRYSKNQILLLSEILKKVLKGIDLVN